MHVEGQHEGKVSLVVHDKMGEGEVRARCPCCCHRIWRFEAIVSRHRRHIWRDGQGG